MPHLALLHEVLNRAGGILDRHLWIDAVLVEEIDAIRLQAPQHVVHDDFDVLGFAVETGESLAGLLINVPSEFRRDYYAVPKRFDGFAEDAFDFPWTVRFSCVEERDTAVERCSDEIDHLRSVRDSHLVFATRVLHTHTDLRDLEIAESAASRPCVRLRTACRCRCAGRSLGTCSCAPERIAGHERGRR